MRQNRAGPLVRSQLGSSSLMNTCLNNTPNHTKNQFLDTLLVSCRYGFFKPDLRPLARLQTQAP
jgi:hypothetical protein